MAVLALSLEEAMESVSTSTESASAEDGAVTRIWRTDITTPIRSFQDVIDTENFFVGGTATPVSATEPGRLARTLPAADPAHPTWFVRKVNSVKGIHDFSNRGVGLVLGQPAVPAGYLQQVGALQTPNYVLFGIWEFNVTYGPRPYPLAVDSVINVYTAGGTTGFYWPDGVTVSDYYYADEWRRFCSAPRYAPQNDYVTAQQGSMIFRTLGGAVPNGFAFTGMPRIFLRTDIVTIEWFGVPYRYISSPNSYIRRFRGLVNQKPWYESQADPNKKVFGAGSLLYLSYDYTDYCPPVSGWDVIFAGNQVGAGFPTQMKGNPRLCNVKLSFLHTDRKALTPITPAWPGWVVDGHNALPWFGNPDQFYYATSQGSLLGSANPANWFPMFNSFPVELLFTDPDAAQPAGFPAPGAGGGI